MAQGAQLRSPRKGVSLPLAGGRGAAARRGPGVPLELRKSRKQAELERIERWMRANLPPPGTPEWEALCTRCGKCCYDKVWRGSRLLLTQTPCSFLDTRTNTCTCYPERFEREPLCMPIGPEIIEMGGLPVDCPYVAGLPGYQGPIEVDKTLDEC